MIGLLLGLLGFGRNFLAYKQAQGQQNQQAMAEYWKYQAAFISATSDIETRIVRQAIVLSFVAALFFPHFGAMIAANASLLPWWMQAVILWEFFGAAALNILPWYKNGKGNGNGTVAAPPVGSSVPGTDAVPSLPSTSFGGSDK
jgi:hypothetical protein